MRFSTRKLRAKRVVGIGLLAGAAVLTASGIVNHYTKNEAQAARSSSNANIYYALRSDYSDSATPNAAMADAAAALGLSSGTAAFCTYGDVDNDYTVTRTNPYTGTSEAYWVFADTAEHCENYDGETILNDNGATVLDANHTFENTSFYGHYDNQLGSELGSFHLISFYDTYAKVQAYGNVAARNLVSDSNNNIAHFEIPTLSYAKNISPNVGFKSFNNVGSNESPSAGGVYGDDDSSVLVVGKDAAIGTADNGDVWTVNGSKVNSPTKRTGSQGQYMNNVWQEYENGPEFLDFDDMKQDAVTLNERIRALSPNLPEENIHNIRGSSDSTDPGMIELADDEGANVMNLVADDLKPTKDVLVVGFDQHKEATLIINVDVKDAPIVDGVKYVDEQMNFLVCYTDSSKLDTSKYGNQGNKPATATHGDYICVNQSWYKDKFPNHIILNYYDSSAPAYSYDAATDSQDEYMINYTKGSTAVTVAPRGNVEVTVTPYQGVIMANNIDMESGDSYFLSLSDNVPIFEVVEFCHYTVHHYKAGTTTKLADDETRNDVDCDNAPITFTASSEVLASQDPKYHLDNAVNITTGTPVEMTLTDNSFTDQLSNSDVDYEYIFYYDENPKCRININHIVIHADGTEETITSEGAEYYDYCGDVTTSVEVSTTLTANNAHYFLYGIFLEDGDDHILPANFPITNVVNNSTQKTYNLYYQDPCSLVVKHVNYTTQEVIRTDDPISVQCGVLREYDHADDLINSGYVPVDSEGNEETTANVQKVEVTGHPTEVTVYYKTRCNITVVHREKGTLNEVADSENYDGFCGELEETISISQTALNNGWKFDNAIESIGDDVIPESGFPYATGKVSKNQAYILEYVRVSYKLTIEHYWEGEDEPFETYEDPTEWVAGASYNMPEEESIVSKEKYGYDSYYWDETSDENHGLFPTRDVVIRYIYKKKTPEVPDTSVGKSPITFAAVGATVALGAIIFARARRR
ncbi:MAG: hypothetical protein Q4A96_02960 [Candidatus Saccharibacteria bacterium]|nr:hypothetical protein [Candidatus Saccharibacteria bacterium]